MPYKVRARKCKQSDKTGGNHVVLKLKRGGGTKQVSCHTTKQLAKSAVRARYASEIGESIMKITAGKLRQIIREEIERIQNPEQLSEQSNEELSALFQKYADDEHPLIKKYIGTKTDRRAHDSASNKKGRAIARTMGFGTPAGRNLPNKIALLIKRVEAEGESPDLLRAIEKAI